MKKSFIILLISLNFNIFSQEKSIITTEISVNPLLNGTLFSPEKTNAKTKLVILIAGSGPTDRNGNQTGAENNSLKFLSENLAKAGIAVFSYDKRIIAQMKTGNVDEKNLSFEDFIEDAKTIIKFFKTKNQFSKQTKKTKKNKHIIYGQSSLLNLCFFLFFCFFPQFFTVFKNTSLVCLFFWIILTIWNQ